MFIIKVFIKSNIINSNSCLLLHESRIVWCLDYKSVPTASGLSGESVRATQLFDFIGNYKLCKNNW